MIPILFEDDDIIVVDKPAGLASQNTANKDISLIDTLDKNVLPVHRLDQRVSGIILFAKNQETLTILNSDFKNRSVTKRYRAIVSNCPPKSEDTLIHWLQKNSNSSKSNVFKKEVAHSKQAILKYKTVQSSIKYHLLQIDLFTGRFHQIRAQLSAIGCPIVGDVKYGFKRTTPDGSIFLQSFYLAFKHPKTKESLTFEIDIPILWNKYGF
ncbi:MAG: RluA family pseudouridine synthase [Chitinophagaceae bacterium]